jgi:hypothetical protein
MLNPSGLNPPNIEDDLEFEWLLCVASTLKACQRIQPTEAIEAKQSQEFPRTKNRHFFKAEANSVIDPAKKEE